jgi:hypothetical protein
MSARKQMVDAQVILWFQNLAKSVKQKNLIFEVDNETKGRFSLFAPPSICDAVDRKMDRLKDKILRGRPYNET